MRDSDAVTELLHKDTACIAVAEIDGDSDNLTIGTEDNSLSHIR